MPNPWFRMYSEVIDDEKLMLLAFEDRWHYVALLACKNKGILDDGDLPLIWRKVAVKLGLDLRTLEEVSRRLAEVDLIEQKTLQPLAWDRRQFQSDTSKERTKAYRDRMKRHSDVTVTVQDTDTDTDTEKEIGQKPKIRFQPPSLEEVKARMSECGYRYANPELFIAFYGSKNWMVGKNKMTDWHKALSGWESRSKSENGGTTGAAIVIPTKNNMDAQIELGRLCQAAGIPDGLVAGKNCDGLRVLLQQHGVGA